MNETTRMLMKAAEGFTRRDRELTRIEFATPDGRHWEITAVPAGRGRRDDYSWGPIPGAPGGYRLFEIDPEGRDGPNEHDAVESDTWELGDMLDYLQAVGQPKPTQPKRPS